MKEKMYTNYSNSSSNNMYNIYDVDDMLTNRWKNDQIFRVFAVTVCLWNSFKGDLEAMKFDL